MAALRRDHHTPPVLRGVTQAGTAVTASTASAATFDGDRWVNIGVTSVGLH